MKKAKLIYFEGCPNSDKAKEVLNESRIEFESIDQTELPSDHKYQYYSSPTILLGDEIIFGQRTGSSACTLDSLDKEELKSKLNIYAHDED